MLPAHCACYVVEYVPALIVLNNLMRGVTVASFPGLPRLRFLIACSMQKLSRKLLWLSFCIMQVIKNRSRGRPGNEASVTVQCGCNTVTV